MSLEMDRKRKELQDFCEKFAQLIEKVYPTSYGHLLKEYRAIYPKKEVQK